MECWATVTVTLLRTEKFRVTQSCPFTEAQDSVLIPGSEPVRPELLVGYVESARLRVH